MRAIVKFFVAAVAASMGCASANAQYYELANQATNMLSTALQGGANYRGFVDVSYISGLGDKKASFWELSTTQGFKYRDWFFMGIGAGIDLMHTQVNDGSYRPGGNEYTQNAAMVPMFTDFRFNIGSMQSASAFFDVRIGAAFYISDEYIQVADGYINTRQSFYLRPSLGVRIPVSSQNSKYAVNIGATYQLLTNSYWYNPLNSKSITLNGLGVNVGFEW